MKVRKRVTRKVNIKPRTKAISKRKPT